LIRQSKEGALTPETFMASVGDVLSDLELRVLLMKIQEHIRNLQRTGVTGERRGCVYVYVSMSE
jgi:hypothetical protein